MTNLTPDEIKTHREMLLVEYETIRKESLDSMAHRTQVVSLGLATVGVLIAGTLAFMAQKDAKDPVVHLIVLSIFGLAMPIVCLLVLYIWFGEVERMMRAGEYLTILERWLNLTLPVRVFWWEQWIRRRKQLMVNNYAVLGTFLFFAASSPLISLLFVGAQTNTLHWTSAPTGSFTEFFNFLFFVGPTPLGITAICRWDVWITWAVVALVSLHLFLLGRSIPTRYTWSKKYMQNLEDKERKHWAKWVVDYLGPMNAPRKRSLFQRLFGSNSKSI